MDMHIYVHMYRFYRSMDASYFLILKIIKKTPWSESASEPSDRRLSGK
jgi:hypothetical protein